MQVSRRSRTLPPQLPALALVPLPFSPKLHVIYAILGPMLLWLGFRLNYDVPCLFVFSPRTPDLFLTIKSFQSSPL
eukprot:g38719.t1